MNAGKTGYFKPHMAMSNVADISNGHDRGSHGLSITASLDNEISAKARLNSSATQKAISKGAQGACDGSVKENDDANDYSFALATGIDP
jgi:hypothetical protein